MTGQCWASAWPHGVTPGGFGKATWPGMGGLAMWRDALHSSQLASLPQGCASDSLGMCTDNG